MGFLQGILNLVTGGAAGSVINKVGNAATFMGIIAALTPVGIAFFKHKQDVLVVITVGDAAFWGAIIAAQLIIANLSRRGA